jgi:hypothetical protein
MIGNATRKIFFALLMLQHSAGTNFYYFDNVLLGTSRFDFKSKKVNQSHYRPWQALRVPGG